MAVPPSNVLEITPQRRPLAIIVGHCSLSCFLLYAVIFSSRSLDFRLLAMDSAAYFPLLQVKDLAAAIVT